MRRATIGGLLVLGWSLGCGGAPSSDPKPADEAASDGAAHDRDPAAKRGKKRGGPRAKAPAGSVWKLTGLESGDVACYLQVEGADGDAQTLDADFDLCPGAPHDATPLVGEQVTATTRPEQVMAASCQGDPECPDHETVDLVISLAPAP